MKVHEILTENPVVWGAVWIMRMLAAGQKAMPAARTFGEKLLQSLKGTKRFYASPKQAQKLEGLSKEASDLANTIAKLKAKQADPKTAMQARQRLEEVKNEMQALLKEVAKNKKRDMDMF